MFRLVSKIKTKVRYGASFSTTHTTARLLFDREINGALNKLERLTALLPDDDPNKQKSIKDYEMLNSNWADLHMQDYEGDDEQSKQAEFQTKKLMTVAKSKYYMLKVNYPKLAEIIDNEPVYDNTIVEEDAAETLTNQTQKQQDEDEAIKVKPLTDQAKNITETPEEEAANRELKQKIIERDQKHASMVDSVHEELAKNFEGWKEVDKAYQESGIAEKVFKQVEYWERQEDEEMKQIFDEEQLKFSAIPDKLKDKVDGQINMDLHGNFDIQHHWQTHSKQQPEKEVEADDSGIKNAGTYVLRDGKLVEGKAEVREQATYSNWYCSNADPEDIRRHRELMDRMHYRGPKWEGQSVPKSILEEHNPTYRKVEQEKHPSEDPKANREGKKGFEYVVR